MKSALLLWKRLANTPGVYVLLGLSILAGLAIFQGALKGLSPLSCPDNQQSTQVSGPLSKSFSEEDFLGQRWFLAKNLTTIEPEEGVPVSERPDIVFDRFRADFWRLETEYLRARLKSLEAEIVSLPEDPIERSGPPVCTRNDSTWHAEWDPAKAEEIKRTRRQERRKVYDVFLFLDEYPLIDIRLNLLADVVDTFVIMMCPVTFMNHSKPMPDPTTFPELSRVKHKIKRLFCDLSNYPYEEPSPWKREEHMRYHAIKQVTDFVGPEDIVTLGDLDELIDGPALDHLAYQPDEAFPVTLYVPLYRASFGCIDRRFNGNPNLWPGTVATIGRLLKEKAPGHADGNEMRDVLRDQNVNRLWCSGWHCSSCMLEPEIKTKLSEYSHAAEVDDNHKLPAVLRDVRDTCLFGFYERRRTLKGVPQYVVDNAERFPYLMPK